MTKDDALKLLEYAPYDDRPSRVNKSLTRAQVVDIVIKGIEALPLSYGAQLPEIFEKRVKQVTQDRIFPL